MGPAAARGFSEGIEAGCSLQGLVELSRVAVGVAQGEQCLTEPKAVRGPLQQRHGLPGVVDCLVTRPPRIEADALPKETDPLSTISQPWVR
jgi:hypothetical protein